MRIGRRLLVMAVGCIALTVAPGAQGTTGDPVAAVSQRNVEHAIAYRASVGFRSDPDFVTQAEQDFVNFPSREFGIALSEAEAAEVMRRSAIQEALGPVDRYVRTLPGFAGVYLDQLDGGKPVFMFVDTSNVRPEEIASRLPPGVVFRLEQARFTYSELQATKTSVVAAEDDLASSGTLIVSETIDVPNNTVLVGIQDSTSETETTLQRRFGPAVTVRKDDVAVADACTSYGYEGCFPLKGGLRIESAQTSASCTSGFMVKRQSNGDIDILTAGHCFVAYTPITSPESERGWGVTWTHGHDDTSIGTASKNTWSENSAADVGFVLLNQDNNNGGHIPTDKNEILVTPSPFVTYSILSVATFQEAGFSVCRNGITSGHTCGHIVSVDARHLSCLPSPESTCHHIDPTVEVDFDSTGGDSGGPYQWLAAAYGVHVHSGRDDISTSHGWYTSAQNATDVFYDRFGVRFLFCLNDGCTSTYP